MTKKTVTLGYWNIRGHSQRIRLVLQYLKIPYTQIIFTPETQHQWLSNTKPQLLKKNPAANLPFLIDGNKVICQSQAIVIYLCHKANRKDLLGQSCEQQTQIATVMSVYKDTQKIIEQYCYGQREYIEFKQQAIQKMRPGLEKLKGLLGNKEWFTGKLSYCDVIVGDFLQVTSLFDQQFVDKYPTLKALQEIMWKLQGISSYLKSGRFKERPVAGYPKAKWC